MSLITRNCMIRALPPFIARLEVAAAPFQDFLTKSPHPLVSWLGWQTWNMSLDLWLVATCPDDHSIQVDLKLLLVCPLFYSLSLIVYVHMHVCEYTGHLPRYVSINAVYLHLQTCVCMAIHTCIYTHTHAKPYICTHIHTEIRICVFKPTHMPCEQMHIHVHMCTNAHIIRYTKYIAICV